MKAKIKDALQVAEALQISSCTFSKIRQNLCWAFGYNLIGLPVAAGALLPGWGFALTPSISGKPVSLPPVAVTNACLSTRLDEQVTALFFILSSMHSSTKYPF
jgi:Cu2+-exporting ATPase